MHLNFLFLNIEYDFYEFRLNRNLFITTNPQLANGSGLEIGPIIEIDEFFRFFERSIFSDLSINEFTVESLRDLIVFRGQYEVKLKVLEELISCFAAGYHDNLIQRLFYRRLLKIVDSLQTREHPAFKDIEAFLKKEGPQHVPFLKGEVLASQLLYIPKPVSKKAPDKLIVGFEKLVEQGYCEITDVREFVASAFKFQAPFQLQPTESLCSFRWFKANSFIDMIDRLRDKRSIAINTSELQTWLETLLPQASSKTIEKNLRDKDKKPVKKFQVDLQVFE